MAKVFIEETTLTAIGDAIRGKEGTTALVPVNDMATRITSLQTGSDPVIKSLEITSNGTYTATDCDGYSPITVNVPQDGAPTDEELVVTGQCANRFVNGGWDWVIHKYGNRITTKDITYSSYMFQNASTIKIIPFELNLKSGQSQQSFVSMFKGCSELREPPLFNWNNEAKYITSSYNNPDMSSIFEGCYMINNIPYDYFNRIIPVECFEKAYPLGSSRSSMFHGCYSLRKLPDLSRVLTKTTYYFYSLYNSLAGSCFSLDEIVNLPVETEAEQKTNFFSNIVYNCYRLKNFTFATNEDGTPKTAKWKSQTIDLQHGAVGWGNASGILDYNSGITADKQVTDDATYQALKNDPDWFTTNTAYSRYNHDSAVATINSLPDTSAYLATAGGTNTIKFKGSQGDRTDGGAINTLTEEEIAVATAKGWTVTLV